MYAVKANVCIGDIQSVIFCITECLTQGFRCLCSLPSSRVGCLLQATWLTWLTVVYTHSVSINFNHQLNAVSSQNNDIQQNWGSWWDNQYTCWTHDCLWYEVTKFHRSDMDVQNGFYKIAGSLISSERLLHRLWQYRLNAYFRWC